MIKYFVILISLFLFTSVSLAEESIICISDKEAVDLITLLDASERDMELLDSCRKLVKDLYKEIDSRDIKIEILTKEVIESKRESLNYATSSRRWRTVAFVTSASTATLLVIMLL